MPIFPTGYSNKTTPVDNDKIAIADSAASNAIKSVTLANLVSNHIKGKLQTLLAWINTPMIGDGQVTEIKLKNTVRFSVFRNAPLNNNGGFNVVAFDAESYDVGNNFASNAFTAPVAGLYFFNWRIRTGAVGRLDTRLTVNGVEYKRGNDAETTGTTSLSSLGAVQVPLAAGDTVRLEMFTNVNTAVTTTFSQCFLEGSLVSTI